MNDELGIAEMFWRAAHGQEPWEAALDSLALPLKARTGQIAMVDPGANILFSRMSRVSQDEIASFIGHNAHLASVNPRLAHLRGLAAGQCIDDGDFLNGTAKNQLEVYRNFFIPTGTSNALTVRLQTSDPSLGILALTTLRPDSVGPASEAERRMVEGAVPAMSAAIEMAMRFGRLETDAMTAALEGVGKPCIALGLGQHVVAMSQGADGLLREGRHLSVRNGRLHAIDGRSGHSLQTAFADVAARGALHRDRRFVAIRAANGWGAPIMAELSPVPSRDTGPFSAAVVLLTIAGQPVPPTFGAAFGDAYDLTLAESGVALGIAQGLTVEAIAQIRGVSRDTVRVQLKAVLLKTGTHRQSELAALMLSLSR